MREFFRGWRRKAGCVTLVMACVFLGAWVRSSFVKDHLTYVSERAPSIQTISFDSHWGVVVRSGFSKSSGPGIRLRQSPVESIQGWATEREGWRWQKFGFGMVHQEFEGGYLKAWFIHYGSLVLPLTLISAYLLLWKPRTKPKEQPNA